MRFRCSESVDGLHFMFRVKQGALSMLRENGWASFYVSRETHGFFEGGDALSDGTSVLCVKHNEGYTWNGLG